MDIRFVTPERAFLLSAAGPFALATDDGRGSWRQVVRPPIAACGAIRWSGNNGDHMGHPRRGGGHKRRGAHGRPQVEVSGPSGVAAAAAGMSRMWRLPAVRAPRAGRGVRSSWSVPTAGGTGRRRACSPQAGGRRTASCLLERAGSRWEAYLYCTTDAGAGWPAMALWGAAAGREPALERSPRGSRWVGRSWRGPGTAGQPAPSSPRPPTGGRVGLP